jgi:hypothetical protein
MMSPMIDEIKDCYERGLQALGNNSTKVLPKDTRLCKWSIDLDSCLLEDYPNAHRWDYVICYGTRAYFLEVHPASTSEVSRVIQKMQWLKDWLNNQGQEINKIRAKKAFHWVYTNKFGITKNSRYARRLAQAGLGLPKRQLRLPQ